MFVPKTIPRIRYWIDAYPSSLLIRTLHLQAPVLSLDLSNYLTFDWTIDISLEYPYEV